MDLSSDDELDVSGVKTDDNINDPEERQQDEAALRAALNFHVGEILSGETAGKPMTGAAVSTMAEVSLRVAFDRVGEMRVSH